MTTLQVRADALQRLATVYSDCGEFDTAWKLFGEAQPAAPDDPPRSHLEILLLIRLNARNTRAEFALYKPATMGRDCMRAMRYDGA